jgi:hypothetical protein
LEEEVSKELSRILLPWCKAIERVKVIDEWMWNRICVRQF